MSSRNVLLKNGVALIHDAENHVVPTKTDILVQDGKIAKIGEGLDTSEDVEVLDCTDKIISPGFIDTHHHGWQTQLKGRHANELLLNYMISGNAQSKQFAPTDIFYGQLAGMLEALDAGTTTIVDHAHLTVSASHVKAGIAATASSGIRSIFCYTPILRAKTFSPLTFHPNPLEEWVMRTFSELADAAPFGNGRVSLGFAWDQWFLPPNAVKEVFELVREKGIRVITVHGPTLFNVIQIAHGFGILDERLLISHGGLLRKEDVQLLREAGAHVSSTPSTELQMTMGRPLCFDAAFKGDETEGGRIGAQDNASLGVDCHTNNAGSIVSEARLGLQNARNHFNEHYLKDGNTPRRLPDSLSVEAAFNLATVKGAEAAKLQEEVGRIKEGFKADFVVFDALSPGMVGAAQHDPVAAVVLHSSPADIETVLVDGIVRKRGGKLVAVSVDEGARAFLEAETLEWRDVAKEIVKSRGVLQKELAKVDVDEGVSALKKLWHVDESTIKD